MISLIILSLDPSIFFVTLQVLSSSNLKSFQIDWSIKERMQKKRITAYRGYFWFKKIPFFCEEIRWLSIKILSFIKL